LSTPGAAPPAGDRVTGESSSAGSLLAGFRNSTRVRRAHRPLDTASTCSRRVLDLSRRSWQRGTPLPPRYTIARLTPLPLDSRPASGASRSMRPITLFTPPGPPPLPRHRAPLPLAHHST